MGRQGLCRDHGGRKRREGAGRGRFGSAGGGRGAHAGRDGGRAGALSSRREGGGGKEDQAGGSERAAAGAQGRRGAGRGGDGRFSGIMSDGCGDVSRVAPARAGFPGGDDAGRRKRECLEQCAAGRPVRRRGKIRERGAGRFAAGYLRLTSDQDQMTRPTMHFCQSPSKSSMRLKTRGGLSAALSE